MAFSKLLAVATALSAASLASAFDAQSKTNLVTYYGQGYNQPRLRDFCQDTTLDIINIGFVNVFPDQGKAGWPGSNFGNQCNGETFTIGGLKTELLSGCSQIAEDIPICQAAGKKVLLSLGGAYPATQKLVSEQTAEAFADFLWLAFGPQTEEYAAINGPRPFGNATVDGFDFDIEHNGGFGYSYMVNRFREHYKEVPDRTFYISGAPQCTIPDAQLSDAIANSAFDFVWVQFYNTPGCSARDFVQGTTTPGFNFDQWVKVIKNSANPDAKLFVGLPASPYAAGSQYYLTPEEVQPLVTKYITKYPETFGGIMLWEATESLVNQIDGGSYADSMKEILKPWAPPPPKTTSSSAIPSSTTTTPLPPTSTSVVPTTSSSSSSTTKTSSSSVIPSSSTTTKTPSSTPVTPTTSTTTKTPSSTPVTPTTSTTTKTPSSTPVTPTTSTTTKTPSSTPVIPTTKTSSSSVPVIPTTTRTPTLSPTPTPSPSTSKSTSSHPTIPTGSTSSTIPGSSAPVPSSSTTSKTTTKPEQTSTTTGKPTDTTTTSSGSSVQSGTSTTSAGITSAPVTTPSTTAPPSTDEPTTITTVIVTSYTSICPTGFTTITTTYTTTYCPATQTATATQPPTGPGAVTSAPAPPEGWTTTVTVCTQCAATPTTVTLTVPCETTAPAVPTTVAPVKPSATETLPEGWTTTVTVCTECGPTPTTVTVTVPITVVPTIPSRPTGVEPVVPPVHTTTSRPLIWGTGGIPRPSSSTLYVKPSSTGQRAPVAPTNAPEDVSPVFTGAAPRVGLGHGMVVAVVAVLGAFLM